MPPVSATFVGLLLYTAILAPLALTFSRYRIAVPVVYCVAIAWVIVSGTGIFRGRSLASTENIVLPAASVDVACQQVLDAIRQAGLEIDRSDPAAPKIVGARGDQVPPSIREVIVRCDEANPQSTAIGSVDKGE